MSVSSCLLTKHRSTLRDLFLLTVLCGLTYGVGLTAHGLSNWHEAERALVAREMQARGDWIVPTINWQPYLAKPPMIYWCQLAIASVRGAQTNEFDLRLTVALVGWLGVLITYVVARRMIGVTAAWWSCLFLATGIRYVHSARIGEIDILLVPFTVAAVGALYLAWRTHIEQGRTNIGAIIVASLATCGVMLAKGPPGLLVIAVAGYGGMALAEAWRGQGRRSVWVVATVAGLSVVVLAIFLNRAWKPNSIIGLVFLAAMLPPVAATVIRLAEPERALALLRAYARAQIVIVLGLPLIVFYAWGRLVQSRIGVQATMMAIKRETADNLRILVADSPFGSVLAASYGTGLGSIACILAIVSLAHHRKITPALWMLIAWVGGGIVAFSVLGKTMPRYLTPVWPGVAMLGGWWFASMLSVARYPRRLAVTATILVLLLAIGQLWWYGFGGERFYDEPSPRSFVQEILALPDVDRSRLATFEFNTPTLDYYVGEQVKSFDAGGPGRFADLKRELSTSDRSLILLVRERQPQSQKLDPRPAIDRLRNAGLEVNPIPLHSRFTIDKWNIPVMAVRVRPRSPGSDG